jgi:glycine hydroxymethyltransferase
MKDFVSALEGNQEVLALRKEVFEFAVSFPMPGFDPESIPVRYRH